MIKSLCPDGWSLTLLAGGMLAGGAAQALAQSGAAQFYAGGLPGPTMKASAPEVLEGVSLMRSPDTVLVRLKAEAASWRSAGGGAAGAHALAGAKEIIFNYAGVPGLVCVRVEHGSVDAAIAAYQLSPAVEYAEANAYRVPHAQDVPYGITLVNAPGVWAHGSQGFGARVSVNDTGVDIGHPDLPVSVATASFIDGETVEDGHSHGTHTSGTVSALDNDFGVVGVAPTVSLMNAKVLANAGFGDTAGVMAGAQWAADNGANVISMSLGGGGFEQAESDLYTAIRDTKNVLIVASAGNDNSATPSYPASYPAVMSIAAVDSNKVKASFSNFGPLISVTAPGVGVESTVPNFISHAVYDGLEHDAGHISGGQLTAATGRLVQCGFGGTSADFPASVAGNIALIRRRGLDSMGQTLTFLTKCDNARIAGAVGVIISNSIAGAGSYSGTTNSAYDFPIVTIGTSDGDALDARLAANENISVTVSYERQGHSYAFFNGTSMSCPHVAGVAGLLIGAFKPAYISVADVRAAIENTAEDLGTPGRDDIFGYGLVNASAAYDYLANVVRPCRLDYNGDGNTNPDDIGDFISDYFTFPPPPGPAGYAQPCPGNAPPYDLGYKAGYSSDRSAQCGEPNPDNLGDWITDYFVDCH